MAKTTNAVAVAECLADQGYRTLLIDADHQCMSGELLLREERLFRCENRKMTLHDLLAAMLDEEFKASQLPYFVVPKVSDIGEGLSNLSLLPCSIRIDDFTTNMAKARRGFNSNEEFQAMWDKRRMILRRWLQANYDFTIIDYPPSIAIQVRFFLKVADSYIVPSIPDRLSVRGSMWLLDRVRRSGIKIQGLGTLWTLYREQNKIHWKIVEQAGRGVEPLNLLPKPFKTIIPNAAAIAEATEPYRKPKSFSAKYTPPFAKLYRELCEEIIQRGEWQNPSANGAKSSTATSTDVGAKRSVGSASVLRS